MEKIIYAIAFLTALLTTLPMDTASAAVKVTSTSSSDYQSSVGNPQNKKMSSSDEAPGFDATGLKRFVLCVDGLKVLQTVGPSRGHLKGLGRGAAGYSMNPAVSTIQLYEERDGQTVPARCR